MSLQIFYRIFIVVDFNAIVWNSSIQSWKAFIWLKKFRFPLLRFNSLRDDFAFILKRNKTRRWVVFNIFVLSLERFLFFRNRKRSLVRNRNINRAKCQSNQRIFLLFNLLSCFKTLRLHLRQRTLRNLDLLIDQLQILWLFLMNFNATFNLMINNF